MKLPSGDKNMNYKNRDIRAGSFGNESYLLLYHKKYKIIEVCKNSLTVNPVYTLK